MKEHAPMDVLRELREDMRQMARWLRRSLDMCETMQLEGDLSDEQYDALEALISRYARASDIVFQRMLRCVDRIELESPGTLLDAIHRAEKRGFFRDERQARRLRELRNEIAHEYVTDNLVPLFKLTTEAAAELLEVIARIDQYSEKYEKNSSS